MFSRKEVKGGRGLIYLGKIRKNYMGKMELDISLEERVAFLKTEARFMRKLQK